MNLIKKSSKRLRVASFVFRTEGQSLVSAMVALGIIGISMVALLSMLTTQQKETRALNEKIASLDFVRVVTQVLATPTTCNSTLAAANIIGGAAPLTFNAANVTPKNNYLINLSKIAGVNNGGVITNLTQSLKIKAKNGIRLRVAGPTSATVTIEFDQTKLVRPLKPLSFPIALQSNGPINNTTITGCGDGSSAIGQIKYLSGNGCGSCPHGTSVSFNPALNIASTSCKIKIHDGSIIASGLLGSMCNSTQVGNTNWTLWTY